MNEGVRGVTPLMNNNMNISALTGRTQTGEGRKVGSESENRVPEIRDLGGMTVPSVAKGRSNAQVMLSLVKSEGIKGTFKALAEGRVEQYAADTKVRPMNLEEKARESTRESEVKKISNTEVPIASSRIPKNVASDPEFRRIWAEDYASAKQSGQPEETSEIDRRAIDSFYDKKANERLKKGNSPEDSEYQRILKEEINQEKEEKERKGEVFDHQSIEVVERRAMAKYLRKRDQANEIEGEESLGDDHATQTEKNKEMKEQLDQMKLEQQAMRLMIRELGSLRANRELPAEYREILDIVKRLLESLENEKKKSKKLNNVMLLVMALFLTLAAPIAEDALKQDNHAA